MHFVDRQARYPNRWTMKKSDGTSEVVTLVRNDEPIVEGTPMNAKTLNTLSDVAGAYVARIAAEESASQAAESEKNAASYSEIAVTSANRAEQSAATNGWMEFEQENGVLYLVKSDSLTDITAQDNGKGILEVVFS